MKTLLTIAAVSILVLGFRSLFQSEVYAQASAPEAIKLWPEGAPGAVGSEPDDIPTLTPFIPKVKANGSAVIVCPGGGYSHLANHEGQPVAEWLNSLGITAFVLKYRIGPKYHHPAPLLEAARAVRLVRSRAAEWKLDPKRIGVLGFSAGGHVASTIGTHFDQGQPGATDAVERLSSRPDLLVLIYPVISMGEFTHSGSRKQLLGAEPTAELVKLLSNELQVTPQTPPCFVWSTWEDKAVPVENSLQFAAAMRKAGVPCDLHVYLKGPHGIGLGRDAWTPSRLHPWTYDCSYFLKTLEFRN